MELQLCGQELRGRRGSVREGASRRAAVRLLRASIELLLRRLLRTGIELVLRGGNSLVCTPWPEGCAFACTTDGCTGTAAAA